MDLRPIPARDWADWYTGELCASFPACECKPLEAIRALAAEGRYELLGLYDGAALLGYATLWSTPEWPDYVLLDYLGVTAARRNGGLGGAILKMLAAREAGGGRYSSRPRRSAPAARRRSGPCGCAAWGSMPETAAPPFMRASTAACSARSLCWGPPRRIRWTSRRLTVPSTARPGRTWS